jgi:hypothetical protein
MRLRVSLYKPKIWRSFTTVYLSKDAVSDS